MAVPFTKRSLYQLSKEISPALAVLLFSISLSYFLDSFTTAKGWEVISRGLFRFIRFTLLLCLPLCVLLPVCAFVVVKMRENLLQTENKQERCINPMKHWIFRPFQGIGIGLLFETKLLTTLQLVTGIATTPLLFPPGHFQFGRLLVISGITIAVSLLLSILWTLDDMGIRYVNLKDQEVKMIGKYIGTLMPILFGFYGIFGLVSNFPKVQALTYLFKTIVVLYPPFVVFAVLHNHFIRSNMVYF